MNLCAPFDTQDGKDEIFDKNVKAILDTEFIILNTCEKDLGTIFEAGYANASGIPIIYYCEGLKGGFNLMLSQSGRAVATTPEELERHVKSFLENPNYFCRYDKEIE